MNHPILDAIAAENDRAAERMEMEQASRREQALQTYYEILGDAERTTPKDRQALRDAMQVLGKSMHHVKNDAGLIANVRAHFQGACDIGEAEKAQGKAEAALERYITVEMPKIEKQMKEEKFRLEEVAKEAAHRTGAARHSRSILDKMFDQMPWIVQFVPGLESGQRPSNLWAYIAEFCKAKRKSPT